MYDFWDINIFYKINFLSGHLVAFNSKEGISSMFSKFFGFIHLVIKSYIQWLLIPTSCGLKNRYNPSCTLYCQHTCYLFSVSCLYENILEERGYTTDVDLCQHLVSITCMTDIFARCGGSILHSNASHPLCKLTSYVIEKIQRQQTQAPEHSFTRSVGLNSLVGMPLWPI